MMLQTSLVRVALNGLLALFLPAAAAAQQDAMTFRAVTAQNCRGPCPAEIVAEGMITLDSASAFRAVAAIVPSNRIVVRLASAGGNLIGGMQLGDALRESNATVVVGRGARCVSACVYAFLGGRTRRVSGGRIGVHRFRPADESRGDDFPAVLVQRMIETLMAYVARMGVDPALVRLALGVAPGAVHVLDATELRRYRLTN
jgi:hypothetical protein